MKLFYKTNRYQKYSITVSAVESWNKIQKSKIMLLKDLSPNNIKTVVTNFYQFFLRMALTFLSNGLVVKGWIRNQGVPCSKPLGGPKIDSTFHPSEADKTSTRNFWELIGKK